jgi:hypothetical protein
MLATAPDCGDKAVSTAGECFNESRILRIVSKRASDVSNMTAQYRRLDESVGPQGLDQFAMRNQSMSVLHKILQNALGANRTRSSSPVSWLRHRHWFAVSNRNGGNSFISAHRGQTFSSKAPTFVQDFTLAFP